VIPFPDKKYNIIYADPPWHYNNYAYKDAIRGVEKEYDTMSQVDLCNLGVSSIAADDSVLLLWSTLPLLKEALDTIDAWGFIYKTTAFVWIKTNKNSMGLFWGMGNWTRSNAELCLLGIKGKPQRLNADVHQVIMSPIGKHSRKPDEVVRGRILQLCGDLPRIELFARRRVDGWDAWGNEDEND